MIQKQVVLFLLLGALCGLGHAGTYGSCNYDVLYIGTSSQGWGVSAYYKNGTYAVTYILAEISPHL